MVASPRGTLRQIMGTQSDRLYTITELASELGVTPRAIRFYESKELLAPQRAGSNRVYTYRERARLLIILRGKRLGFSLRKIKEYLDLYDAEPGRQVEQLELLLRGARRRMADLERQRTDIDLTLAELREVEEQTLTALRSVQARQQRQGRSRDQGQDQAQNRDGQHREQHESPPEPDELPVAGASGRAKTVRRR